MTALNFDGPLDRVGLQAMGRQVDHWVSDYSRTDIHLDAEYQRGSVWSVEQKQNLIRSLLMDLPIGSIVVNERPDVLEGFYVIDGKQRVEALRDLVDDKFPIPASWVLAEHIVETEEVPGWPVPGARWSGTTEVFKRFFRRRGVPSIEARVKTVTEEAEIFRLINSAGTAQTEDTLTHAAEVEGL